MEDMSKTFIIIAIVAFSLFVGCTLYNAVLSLKNKELRERIGKDMMKWSAIVFLGIATLTVALVGSNSWSANVFKSNVLQYQQDLSPNELKAFVK